MLCRSKRSISMCMALLSCLLYNECTLICMAKSCLRPVPVEGNPGKGSPTGAKQALDDDDVQHVRDHIKILVNSCTKELACLCDSTLHFHSQFNYLVNLWLYLIFRCLFING